MKSPHSSLFCAAVFLSTSIVAPMPLMAQEPALAPADAAGAYEVAPVLKASQILRPEYLQGSGYQVRETVSTWSGANRYIIDSDYGLFVAEGNSLLEQRVAEIAAMNRMAEISKGEEYGIAVVNAAKSPIELAKNLASDPVATVSSVPKGLWKFVNRAGQEVKEATSGRKRSGYEESAAKDLLGFSKIKRELAIELHVNPYSTNEVFQKELNKIAWTCFAGNATIKGVTMGLSGGAAIVATSISVAKTTSDALRDSSPADLRRINQEKLIAMGISKANAGKFLANPAFSPWHQTVFVAALGEMGGVKGRAELVKAAANEAEDETDALFFTHTAKLIGILHRGDVKIDRIVILNGLPVCVAKDGRTVVALQWDYAAWTPLAARLAAAIQEFEAKNAAKDRGRKSPGHLLALSGDVSPRLRQELAARGVEVRDRLASGPLK